METKYPSKGQFLFDCEGSKVKFSGNFDSGNLLSVEFVGSYLEPYVTFEVTQFRVHTSLDSYSVEVTAKTYFHFSVQGYPIGKPIKIVIPNVKLLLPLQKAGKLSYYRPHLKMGPKGKYLKMNQGEVAVLQDEQVISVQIKLTPTDSLFFLAFSHPYPYQRYLNFIRDLPKSDEQFYIRKQVLCYSLELRLVFLLTISSFDEMRDSQQVIGGQSNGIIFPQRHISDPQKEFNKPVVIISARVHPGESQSSFAMEGIIKFLMSKDLRAYILRKHFHFLIVPMLNPDGVYYGYYRMDTTAINLNRYYVVCDSRQPSIYSLRHLINYYSRQKRLLYYFDLHGHPAYRGSFLYGNAMEDIVSQTQTCLFSKLISLNTQTFSFEDCNFSKMQMKCKDRLDELTKEGCGRVYTYRYSNIIHSYTIEFGFHSSISFNKLEPESNNDYVFESGTTLHSLQYQQHSIQEPDKFQYTPQSYSNQGVAVLISILDSLEINPYSRIPNTQLKSNAQIRRQISKTLLLTDRFRIMERNITLKINSINDLVQQIFFKQIAERGFLNDNSKKWPSCVNFAKYAQRKKLARNPFKKRSIDADFNLTAYSQTNYGNTSQNLDKLRRESEDYQQKIETTFTIQQKQIVADYTNSKISNEQSKQQSSEDQKMSQQKRQSQSYSPPRQKMKLRVKYTNSSSRRSGNQISRKQTVYQQQSSSSAILDLINFDDSKLQMHRFAAAASPTKLDRPRVINKSGEFSKEVNILIQHQNNFNKGDVTEYKNVFVGGKQRVVDKNQIKLIHVASQSQKNQRLVHIQSTSQPHSSLEKQKFRRNVSSRNRDLGNITPTQLPQLDSARLDKFSMYFKSAKKGFKE